jgi:hypothetical protein
MQEFIRKDVKLKAKGEMLDALANLTHLELIGIPNLDEVLAWAEKFLGKKLGPRPAYNPAVQQNYGRGYARLRNPNQNYFDWKVRRDYILELMRPWVEMMSEYLLRHVVSSADYSLEKRHAILEFFSRDLFCKYCNECSDGAKYSTKIICCSKKEWEESVMVQIPKYIEEATESMKKVCSFSEYDFVAISAILGCELPKLTKVLEAQAIAKINTQAQCALAEYMKFKEVVNSSAAMGMMRENKLKFECRVLKSRISVQITDIGKGLVVKEKVSDAISNAVGTGIGLAAVGTAAVCPPLFAAGAVALMIFGACAEGKTKRR